MTATPNPPLERTAAAVYFTCGRASRVRRRGRSTALRYAAKAMRAEHSIDERLANGASFDLAELQAIVAGESDLAAWASVRDALRKGYSRISPPPDMQFNCEFIARYLLRVIHEAPQGDRFPSHYEAAGELAECCKHWSRKIPLTGHVLEFVSIAVTEAYQSARESEQLCLVNGFLEHALEDAAIRPCFESWKLNPELAPAWHVAMQWATAQGDSAA